jgi:hypothetical protein
MFTRGGADHCDPKSQIIYVYNPNATGTPYYDWPYAFLSLSILAG